MILCWSLFPLWQRVIQRQFCPRGFAFAISIDLLDFKKDQNLSFETSVSFQRNISTFQSKDTYLFSNDRGPCFISLERLFFRSNPYVKNPIVGNFTEKWLLCKEDILKLYVFRK